MSETDALHAEVVALVDELRDKALAARVPYSAMPWRTAWGAESGDRLDEFPHIAAWSPAAVLLLVGDNGMLRRQARRSGDDLASIQAWVRADANQSLRDLRDTLRAMRDAT